MDANIEFSGKLTILIKEQNKKQTQKITNKFSKEITGIKTSLSQEREVINNLEKEIKRFETKE